MIEFETELEQGIWTGVYTGRLAAFYKRMEFDVVAPKAEQEAVEEAETRATQAVLATRSYLPAADKSVPASIALGGVLVERNRELKEKKKIIAHLNESIGDMFQSNEKLRKKVAELEQQKNTAYAERNRVLAALAKAGQELGWNVGVGQHDPADTNWESDCRTLLFIDLPTGQASWHYPDNQKGLLEQLPKYASPWDGHSTVVKYERVWEYVSRSTADTTAPSEGVQKHAAARLKASEDAWATFENLRKAGEHTGFTDGTGERWQVQGMLVSPYTGEPYFVVASRDVERPKQITRIERLPQPLTWESEAVRDTVEKHHTQQY